MSPYYVVPLLVNGRPVEGDKHLQFPVISASTGEIVHYAQGANVVIAQEAVKAAEDVFPAWSSQGAQERRILFNRAAKLLRSRTDDFVQAQVQEISCTPGYAKVMVQVGVGFLEEMAAAVTSAAFSGVIPQTTVPGCIPMVLPEPYGVVLGICPWNAPLALGFRAIGTPLAAGNTTIMKSSELCPKTHHLIAKVFQDAGFPAGSVNLIHHRPEDASSIVSAMISDPGVRKVNFTGSSIVGRIIAQTAASHLKPVTLELGGKCPLIVLEGSDLQKAAKAAVEHAFLNSGQICMSTERVIVQRSVSVAFKEALVDELKKHQEQATLVTAKAAEKVESLIKDAKSKGAEIHTSRRGKIRDRASMTPSIIFDVTPAMRLYKEESFGPCTSVITVSSADEAVQVANESAYGLSAAVFCGDTAKAIAVAKKIQSGAVHINSGTFHDEHTLPHGGTKQSGWGRFGSTWGLQEFLQTKTVMIHGVSM